MAGKKSGEIKISKKNVNLIIFFSIVVVIALITVMFQYKPPVEPATTTTPIAVTTTEPIVVEEPKPSETTVPEVTEPQPEEHTVEIINFQFVPRELTINQGDTVTWINVDWISDHIRPHLVKEHHNEFMSDRLLGDETFSHTFNTPGTYTYIDSIFPDKARRGVITVVETNQITGSFAADIDSNPNLMVILLALVILAGMLTGYFLGYKEK